MNNPTVDVFCVCCGDFIHRVNATTKIGRRQKLCLDCAAELNEGKIVGASTLQHGTGGGKRVIRDPKGLS